MFERILSLFHPTPHVTELPPEDARHALGALLVRTAKADKAYLFEEVETIDRILSQLYDLNPVEAAMMRAACEKLEHEMPPTEELAAILHDTIPMEDRVGAVAALWRVVFADGAEDAAEDDVLLAVQTTLGVSAEVSQQLHDDAMNAPRG